MSGILPINVRQDSAPFIEVKTPDIRTAQALIGFRGRVKIGRRIELPAVCNVSKPLPPPRPGRGRTEALCVAIGQWQRGLVLVA
jgi:hypothetical protein